MGKCEIASASIGIQILLKNLLSQITESNYKLIKKMLLNGIIEDSNDYFNEVFQDIVNNDIMDKNYLVVKEYLIKEFCGCLRDKPLLVPIKNILETDRWGYDRYGTNGSSRPLDFDLSINIDEYKEIKDIKVVFMLSQRSG